MADRTPAERREALKWVFRQYRVLVRAFSRLEALAPNSAAAGYAEDDKVRDFIEIMKDKPDETQRIAENLQAKVKANHLPEHFWGAILQRCGL